MGHRRHRGPPTKISGGTWLIFAMLMFIIISISTMAIIGTGVFTWPPR